MHLLSDTQLASVSPGKRSRLDLKHEPNTAGWCSHRLVLYDDEKRRLERPMHAHDRRPVRVVDKKKSVKIGRGQLLSRMRIALQAAEAPFISDERGYPTWKPMREENLV